MSAMTDGKESAAWKDTAASICVYVMLVTLVAAAIVVFVFGWVVTSWSAAIGGVVWALALSGLGLVIGFLFGVPKSRRDPSATGVLRANTNLEDVSDWLSKIIVGTGLVELKASPDSLRRLAVLIAGTLGVEDARTRSVGAAIALVFPSFAFLIAYLVTRLWLQPEIAKAELDQIKQSVDSLQQKVQENQAKIESNEQVVEQAKNLAKVAMGVPAAQLERPEIAEVQALSVWDSDPHKGKFGGSPVNNGRELSAVVTPVLAGESTCRIRLQVKSLDVKSPLTGSVTFFLHPTFSPDEVPVQVDDAGIATLETLADGPFTVGATADGGSTRLELDLASVTGGTPEFYAD